ncbi:hypothetical protein ThvES_00021330, partial [Thiovulum sp. ES]
NISVVVVTDREKILNVLTQDKLVSDETFQSDKGHIEIILWCCERFLTVFEEDGELEFYISPLRNQRRKSSGNYIEPVFPYHIQKHEDFLKELEDKRKSEELREKNQKNYDTAMTKVVADMSKNKNPIRIGEDVYYLEDMLRVHIETLEKNSGFFNKVTVTTNQLIADIEGYILY